MEKDNSKVPVAILSCFLIAFVLQGILKLCGVFVFEKALTWDIFRIIDSSKILTIGFQWIINIIAVYCLSFALTSRAYSNKWYHYVIIALVSLPIIILRTTTVATLWLEYLYDIILYIGVPIVINSTTDKKYKLFEDKDITSIVITISIQILLYFCYLGLSYWSGLTSSMIPVNQTTLNSSASFLIFFELYIGLTTMMLSLNNLIQKWKKEINKMFRPQNIASDEAIAEELAEVESKEEK